MLKVMILYFYELVHQRVTVYLRIYYVLCNFTFKLINIIWYLSITSLLLKIFE